MLYTIGEIIVFMLLAAVIGFFIGWLFRGLSLRSQVEERFEREISGRQLRINTLEEEIAGERDARAEALDAAADNERLLAEQKDLTVTLEARLGEAEAATGDLHARIQALQSELDGGASSREVSDALVRTRELEEALAARDADVERMERSLNDAKQSAPDTSALDSRIASLEAELAMRDHELADARSAAVDRPDVEDLRAKIDALDEELDTRDAQITRLEKLVENAEVARSQAEAAVADADSAHAAMDNLRRELDGRKRRIDDLERRLAESDSGGPTDVVQPLAGGNGAEPDADVDPMTLVALRTADGAPASDDDLTRVHGIGPKIEQLLKSMGITSYRQVARLTADDIEILNERLGRFRDRMRRDDWMSSAADLHREVHGSEV